MRKKIIFIYIPFRLPQATLYPITLLRKSPRACDWKVGGESGVEEHQPHLHRAHPFQTTERTGMCKKKILSSSNCICWSGKITRMVLATFTYSSLVDPDPIGSETFGRIQNRIRQKPLRSHPGSSGSKMNEELVISQQMHNIKKKITKISLKSMKLEKKLDSSKAYISSEFQK